MKSPGLPELTNSKVKHLASFKTFRMRFCKLHEAIWLPVIDKIFKFSPHFYPFEQVNYLCMTSPQANRIIQF